MSDNGNDGKESHSKPLIEHPENYEASFDISGSMEGSSRGEPSTAEKQVLGAHSTVKEQIKDASSQSEGTGVHALRDKWEEIGKKTYAEMASALPGGAERYTYQRHVHSGEPLQVHTKQEQQFSDQHPQGVVMMNPLQENPDQGSQPLQGSSNQDWLCLGSNTSAPAEYGSKDQHLQGPLLDGSGLHGHFEVMLIDSNAL